MFWVRLVLAGIATGCVYSLAGMGVVLTYKATGIFNFAHGAIAMIVAYVLWQLNHEWHWSLAIAAPFVLLVVGPGIGLLLERLVFRPLQRRRASTSEKLVATLGVFLICLGAAYAIWTGTTREGPHLISSRAIDFGNDLYMGIDQLVEVVLVGVVSVGLWLMFRFTHIGTEIRAVVDRRELSELSAVNADRVSALAWAMGTGLAGLTGVLLAQRAGGLDPFHLTLLVIESFSIVVVARLVSLPVAVAAGILLLGVLQSLLTRFNPHVVPVLHWHLPTGITSAIGELKPNLSVLILFGALVFFRTLDEVGEDSGRSGLVSRALGGRRDQAVPTAALVVGGAVVAIAVPFVMSANNMTYAHQTLAYIIVFASIVCVTGFSGHITLGQAAFAGFGAFVSSRVINQWDLPVIPAMLIGGLGATVLGIITGYPALRRRGVFLGLTTLAIGVLAYSFVFTSNTFAGGPGGLDAPRPSLFGLSLAGDRAFYFFELVCVGLMLLLARNLKSGRLGRVLAAVRDSEVAARSVGIDLRAYKLFIFGASAFMAGIGGALLSQEVRAFSFFTFDPFSSLRWFMVVIVAGVGSLSGAVIGAIAFVGLSAVFKTQGASELIIAVLALGIGYLPGGSISGLLSRAAAWLRTPRSLLREYASPPRPATTVTGDGNGLVPSEFARRVLEDAH